MRRLGFNPTRRVSFHYDLLRGGAFYARLRADEGTAPHVRMQDNAQIKMSFSGVFGANAQDVDGGPMDVNWLTDEIQPVMNVNGIDYPLGVYIPTTQSVTDNVVRKVRIEAYDRCQRVLDTNSAVPVYWPRGTLYLDAVEQLLSAAGVTTVFKTDTDAAFTEAREDWAAGTPFLTIVNDLLAEINYKGLFFDANGAAVLEPSSIPEAAQIAHTLDDADPETLVVPGITRQNDTFSAPNKFIVVCANPDKGENMVAVSVNDNPQSPLSTVRRGREIVRVSTVDNISSQSELQAYADRLRNDSLLTSETVSVTTGLLPGWGVADVVALHTAPRAYIERTRRGKRLASVPGSNDICISRAYDMELKVGGKMQHTLEKVVYNLE
ncbi:MAG: hypothetical protein VZQ96_07050 [Succiniclasticum sp.]|nr:hypothetical protein [Succiniclasticum sp.]